MPTNLITKTTLKLVRERRQKLAAKVVAITGTAGKTTTKCMIASILQAEYNIVSTSGNANLPPHVASYIWNASPDTQILVLEMGMDRRGQIAQSSLMALPDVAVVTNVDRGHLDKCGGFAGVVKAKSEIIRGMGSASVLVINADDLGSQRLNLRKYSGRIVTFGRGPNANYRLISCIPKGFRLTVSISGEGHQDTYSLPTIGEHNGYNAAAAIAATRALGVPWDVIKSGLSKFKRPHGRLTPKRGLNGALVIDDAFNANPRSVVEGLKTIVSLAKGRRTVAVLGNMEEQGDEWRSAHAKVGRVAANLGISHLISVGRKARYIAYSAMKSGMPKERIHVFRTRKDAIIALKGLMAEDSIIFLKGSHSTNLYAMVQEITKPLYPPVD